jgi:hypothetical protein
VAKSADLKIRNTADLEVGATGQCPNALVRNGRFFFEGIPSPASHESLKSIAIMKSTTAFALLLAQQRSVSAEQIRESAVVRARVVRIRADENAISSERGHRTETNWKLVLLCLALLLCASPAFAMDIFVVNNADSGNGTLRQAIQFNESLGGGNTIVFSNTVTGTITLTNVLGELLITKDVNIVGPGPKVLAVSGNNAHRVFHLTNNATVSISGLAIREGRLTFAGFGSEDFGAGIRQDSGTLTVSDCILSANINLSYAGGAISARGTLLATRCAFTENLGDFGGGGLWAEGTVTVINCTFAKNSGPLGAGIKQTSGSLVMTNCTISGNAAGSFGTAGGVFVEAGTVAVRNTIIASNSASQYPDCYGTFSSAGYNLIGAIQGSTGWGALGDQLGSTNSYLNPMLTPLYDDGATLTMPPQIGSPAIDQGNSSGVFTDQRGRPRPYINNSVVSIPPGGDRSDIGAVEIGGLTNWIVTTTNDSGAGSLRQAISNAYPSERVITFAPNITGTIRLTSGELVLNSLQIAGPGPDVLTISGNNSSRVFNIIAGGAATISGLTIANGAAPYPNNGGGILALGTLNLSNCLLSANNSYKGGAVSSSANFTADRCTFVQNNASTGGALALSGPSILNNSTIASNTGCAGCGIYNSAGLTATACTIVGNHSLGNDCKGGGIYACTPATIRNSIIAGNFADEAGSDVYLSFVSGGYNLIGETNDSGGFGAVGDQLGSSANPLNSYLLPLGMNGGPTLTMPPSDISPALDQGKRFGLTTDQRGRIRPYTNSVSSIPSGGDHSDIGAVEVGTPLTLLVTTTNDFGPGSLRNAIAQASSFEYDIVAFAPHVTNTITLTSGPLNVNKYIQIAGPGANVLRISGNNASRVFNLSSLNATISGLTIADGWSGNSFGGGILVDGGAHVLVSCQVVSNSTAATLSTAGGGLCALNNSTVTLYNCSLIHNQGGYGGGGIALGGGSPQVYINNCTIASNRTTWVYNGLFYAYGGGIFVGSGILNVVNSTIAGNYCPDFDGGIICAGGAIADVRNSIIANNTAANSPDVGGSFSSGGYNLIGNSSGSAGFGAIGDQLNVNPLLGPLANYGGPTLTMALRAGSPAIDKGKSFGLTTDQRGFTRPLDDLTIPNASGGDNADIGAFEVAPNFRIVDLRRVGSDVALSLMTVLGRNYRVEYTNNLASGTWTTFTDNVPGNGWLLWVTNSGGASQPRRFYRGAIVP